MRQEDPSIKVARAGLWGEEPVPWPPRSVHLCSVLVCVEHRDSGLPKDGVPLPHVLQTPASTCELPARPLG